MFCDNSSEHEVIFGESRESGIFFSMTRSEGLTLGGATTGEHKILSMRPFMGGLGHKLKWLQVVGDIAETEDHSPATVLPDKLRDYAHALTDTLSFLSDIGESPHALSVFDVLGLSMPNLNDPLGSATKVLKKSEIGNPVYAAAEHFGEMLEDKPSQGRHWHAYMPTAGIAPIDRRGDVDLSQAKSLWDQPIWVGFSPGLVRLMADPKQVSEMVEKKDISPDVFNASSICGLKAEILVSEVGKLAAQRPHDGLSMRVVYRRMDATIDSQMDRHALDGIMKLMVPAMANATPSLALQIFNTMAAFKMN